MKKITLIGFLIISILLSGCGKQKNVSNNQTSEYSTETSDKLDADIESNTEEIFTWHNSRALREIADGVILDAQIKKPDNIGEEVEICKVEDVSFDGSIVKNDLFPDMKDFAWTEYNYEDGLSTTFYEGNLIFSPLKNQQSGQIILGEGIYFCTDHWKKINQNLPITNTTHGMKSELEIKDFDFESYEDAQNYVETVFNDILGMKVSLFQGYAISHEELAEREEINIRDMGEPIKGETVEKSNWSDEDDCYYYIFERYINGLPMMTDYYVRKGEGTAATGNVTVGYTDQGVEYIELFGKYEVVDKSPGKMKAPEEIINTLKQKFELLIVDDVTLTEMKLIYFPYYMERNQYEFVPVWRITCNQNGQESYVYIEAISGEEVTE